MIPATHTHLVRPVRPFIGLVHEALHEGLPVGVDGLGHVKQAVPLRVYQRVEAVVQHAPIRDRRYGPPEEVVVARYLRASSARSRCGCVGACVRREEHYRVERGVDYSATDVVP